MNTGQIILVHSRADRLFRSGLEEALGQHDVTVMEWLLLNALSKGPDDGLSMSAVSQELDVTLPQVTALMTSVVKKKYVKLKTQRRDRRSRHALMTGKGEQVLAGASKDADKAIQAWFADIPKDQLDTYLGVMNKLAFSNQGA